MPQAIMRDPTPAWLKPGAESVTDSNTTKALRALAKLIGADDPASQVMGVMTSGTPAGEGGVLGMVKKAIRKARPESAPDTAMASVLLPPGEGKITTGAKTWIDATGDVVSGDSVKFKRGIFSGSFKRPKFEGYEDVEGKILKESYGDKTGQHTFTIQTPDGGSFRIMGRNLYKHGVMRQQWDDEASRVIAANEKHQRGGNVRAKRSEDRYGPFGQ